MALEVLPEIVAETVYPVAQVHRDILDLMVKQVLQVLQVCSKYSLIQHMMFHL